MRHATRSSPFEFNPDLADRLHPTTHALLMGSAGTADPARCLTCVVCSSVAAGSSPRSAARLTRLRRRIRIGSATDPRPLPELRALADATRPRAARSGPCLRSACALPALHTRSAVRAAAQAATALSFHRCLSLVCALSLAHAAHSSRAGTVAGPRSLPVLVPLVALWLLPLPLAPCAAPPPLSRAPAACSLTP